VLNIESMAYVDYDGILEDLLAFLDNSPVDLETEGPLTNFQCNVCKKKLKKEQR